MLASLLARYSDRGRHEGQQYLAWRMALERLRSDHARGLAEISRLREYLEDVPEQHRPLALQDLAAMHLELSWRLGEGPLLEDYIAEFGREFAELSSPAVAAADLIEDEFLARYRSPVDERPTLDDYRRRFPGRPEVIAPLKLRLLGDERYVKLHIQGRGAASVVWQAYDRRLNRRVAVQFPHPSLCANAAAAARFIRDIRELAALDHAGIVAVHELHDDAENPWCAMEWIEGESLSQRINDCHAASADRSARQRRQLERQLLAAFAGVCHAMAYAHSRGVLHRDLKPGNILVGDDGRAVIVDWQRDVVGTPEYMSPEQVDGRCEVRSDVFGLGGVLYEILTGRAPRHWGEHRRPADWPVQVRQAQIVPPQRLKPDAPRALAAVAMKALARDPAERHASAAEVALEVDRYLAGESPAARRQPWLPCCWPWSGNRPQRELR